MNYFEKATVFLRRFHGRQDLYARKWTKDIIDKNGETKKKVGYSPVCHLFLSESCYIKNKVKGKKCENCEHRQLVPISKETVLKHIWGKEEHMYYMLLPEGVIRFGVIDFDMKDKRKDEGYTWSDVERTHNKLNEWNIPHAIARSTGSGFHIYFFFSEPYPSQKFRKFIGELYQIIGFTESERPMPEFFPKQDAVSVDGFGNGIKPPMIESKFAEGRNCFVDGSNTVIGSNLSLSDLTLAQWTFLEQVPDISADVIDSIVDMSNNAPDETSLTVDKKIRAKRREKGKQANFEVFKRSFSKDRLDFLLSQCEAVHRLAAKGRDHMLGYHEGFALISIIRHFDNWRKWFRDNIQGWDDCSENELEIDRFLESNTATAPYSCETLQSRGICPFRDREACWSCLRDENGNPKSPSPIRFATQDVAVNKIARYVARDLVDEIDYIESSLSRS